MMAPGSRASELVALGAQLGDDLVDAFLLDGAHAAGRQTQRHPALLRLHPEALRMQVRQEAAALLVVGVRDAVTDGRLLAGDLADAGHTNNLERFQSLRIEGARLLRFPGRALYQPGGGISRTGAAAGTGGMAGTDGVAGTGGMAGTGGVAGRQRRPRACGHHVGGVMAGRARWA